MILSSDNLPSFLGGINDFSSRNNSYSPFYSNVGIEIHKDGRGAGKFWLHINRFSRVLWHELAGFPAAETENASPWKISFAGKTVTGKLAFWAPDCFLLSVSNAGTVPLLTNRDPSLSDCWFTERTEKSAVIRGYSGNGDARDPDETMPFVLGIKAIKGSISAFGELHAEEEDGECLLAFAFEALEISEERVREKLALAPVTVTAAAETCLAEIRKQVCDLHFECGEDEAAAVSKAVNGLIANTVKAPGRLKTALSSYPSRGYSSHFMWDTCFQNLAYEEMNLSTAKDLLLQFAACQRADGKYEQFLCSTWGRPGYAQPPLTGWAALRIACRDRDPAFISTMLSSIERNTEWWLANRMTKYGLICCPHGLETGQDDSPRFDGGTTLACDMNSYLLDQMRSAAALAKMTGDREREEKWNRKAAAFGKRMTDLLWCEEDGIFYDVLPSDGSFVKIVSPVSFLPFWAGIGMDEAKRERSVRKYLLNPEYLFGTVPFPSVAYNEKTYTPDGWWRGPTWMPNAWLMLETLEKAGHTAEMLTAAKRLYDVIAKDGEMHELFDSSTGKGLGETEQGWTCAIFIALIKVLKQGGMPR